MVMPGHALKDHQVLIGLEARSKRPFDLLVVADVDVLVEYEDVLEPRDAAEQRRDGQPRLAETALPDRDAQRVRAARCVQQIGRDRRRVPRPCRIFIASASVRMALMFWLSVWSSTNAEPCCSV